MLVVFGLDAVVLEATLLSAVGNTDSSVLVEGAVVEQATNAMTLIAITRLKITFRFIRFLHW
jgi:hypothetical protein